MTDGVDAQQAAQLAADLAVAHRRVRAFIGSDDEKALASRRLLAINDAAKHDVATATRRLNAFLRDLDNGRIGLSESHEEP